MSNPTVAEYVVGRIASLGIEHVFGVPGDYAFPWNDAIETSDAVQWVGTANELNAAYAADGYARVRGAAMLCTTFGPGELSAINGVMGALAESVPVFWLVGLPSTQLQRAGRIPHHMLRDGDYTLNARTSWNAVAGHAELTPENAILETERIIEVCLSKRQPVYINVPQDYANLPVVGDPIVGIPLANVAQPASDPRQLAVAAAQLKSALADKSTAVALPSYWLARYGLAAKFDAFAASSGIAYAAGPMDKAVASEASEQCLGLYCGLLSAPGVKEAVESADVVLDFDVCFSDENAGSWTDAIDPAKHVVIGPDFVRIGEFMAAPVSMSDSLDVLAGMGLSFSAPRRGPAPAPPAMPDPDDRVSSAALYPRLQQFLRPGDIVVSETGLSNLALAKLRMPEGVTYLNQPLWGSIGWATPAALGAALADPSRRVVLITGDGSHQLTANELGVMGRYEAKPVILLLNNKTFGVEELVSDTARLGHEYNKLAPWRYHEVPAAMGCPDWFAVKVHTVAELDTALAHVSDHGGPAYLELDLGAVDVPPRMPAQLLERNYGLTPGT